MAQICEKAIKACKNAQTPVKPQEDGGNSTFQFLGIRTAEFWCKGKEGTEYTQKTDERGKRMSGVSRTRRS